MLISTDPFASDAECAGYLNQLYMYLSFFYKMYYICSVKERQFQLSYATCRIYADI